MKWLTVLVVVCALPCTLGLNLMACPLVAVSGSSSGLVACAYTSENSRLMCAFQYSGFGSALTGVDIQRTASVAVEGDDDQPAQAAMPAGQLIDFTNIVAGLSAGNQQSGSFDGLVFGDGYTNASLVPGVYTYVNNTFAGSMARCFGGSPSECSVTMRTASLPNGEASCTFGGLTFGASFEFALNVNKSVAPNSAASGVARLGWFVSGNSDAASADSQSVWTYVIEYSGLSSPVASAGLFNAGAGFPQITSMPATLAFNTQRAVADSTTSGTFSGVVIQKSTGLGGSGFGGYNLATAALNFAFLSDCAVDYCYVGVQTNVLNPIMELRGQLVAGVGTLLPSVFTLFCVLVAVFYSL